MVTALAELPTAQQEGQDTDSSLAQAAGWQLPHLHTTPAARQPFSDAAAGAVSSTLSQDSASASALELSLIHI